MKLFSLIYLKGGKAQRPVGTNPPWFQEDATRLAKALADQGADGFYIHDLSIPVTGKSENLQALQNIRQQISQELWVTGNFRSLESLDLYAKLGVDKIVLAGVAYQIPNFVREAVQKFYKKISVLIEVKNHHVVIPGLLAPSRKTAVDYAQRFEEEGATSLCLWETNAQGGLDATNFKSIGEFCEKVKVPVCCLSDIQDAHELAKLFEIERAGLFAVVLGKAFYAGRIDLKGAKAMLYDLAASITKEETLL